MRHAKRDPGGLDLVLRAYEPLRHGLAGDEERACDLLRAQPAQRAQRERDLCIEREGRMAASEEELEPLVRNRLPAHVVLHGLRHVEEARLLHERAVATDAVDCAVSGGGHQPRARVGRRPIAGPPLGGDRERLLDGFLGEVEVAEEADQAGEDAAPLVAEDLLEDRYCPLSGRTSTEPPMEAAGTRDASSIAASRSSASKNR